jgi:hypothetical protein
VLPQLIGQRGKVLLGVVVPMVEVKRLVLEDGVSQPNKDMNIYVFNKRFSLLFTLGFLCIKLTTRAATFFLPLIYLYFLGSDSCCGHLLVPTVMIV